MQSPTRRQYLLIDKRCRRYSAPDDLRSGFSKCYTSEESEDESKRSRVSTIDLSVLFEHSDSDSSLELDTSISRSTSPVPPCSSQLFLPAGCYDCRNSQNNENTFWALWTRQALWSLCLGQLMSFCVSILDLIIHRMNKYATPLSVSTQNLPLYLYLSFFWTTQLAMREGGRGIGQVLRLSGLRYILLALLHVQATTLAVSALRHKTYVGNQMIDCVASTLSFLLAFVCLEVEFQVTHAIGFATAFLGALGMCTAITSQTDSNVDDDVAAWGDLVRFGSGLFLCFSTLAEELIVKSIDTVEYLGMIGLLGSFICGLQAILLDGGTALPSIREYWYYWIIYSLVQFTLTCLAPRVLRDVGATGMHLSLITSTFYTSILEVNFRDISQLFLISFLLITSGNYIFAMKRAYITQQYFYPVRVTITRTHS